MKRHHAIADAELSNAVSHLGDDTRGFVTKNARRGVRAGRNLLQIGAADSTSVDPNQNLSRSDFRHGHFFQTDVVHAAIHGRPHRGRNLTPYAFSCECLSNCHSRAISCLSIPNANSRRDAACRVSGGGGDGASPVSTESRPLQVPRNRAAKSTTCLGAVPRQSYRSPP